MISGSTSYSDEKTVAMAANNNKTANTIIMCTKQQQQPAACMELQWYNIAKNCTSLAPKLLLR
jgi:hypothetical protein